MIAMSRGALYRMAKTVGEAWIYTTWTEGAEDAYGDVAFSPQASASTILALRSDRQARRWWDESGEERLVDVSVIFPFPVTDEAGNVISIQDDSTKRAATLTDAAGRVYKVVGVGHEAETPLGGLRVLCVREVTS